ncbi:MAG: gliding motility-associated C-terminal domain-containing protein, partial [Bacteroidetes bacterium]
ATNSIWSTAGDGTFDDFTSLTPVYTPDSADIANGSVALILTTNDPPGVCSALSDQLVITIELLATVNAGINFSICTGNAANLSGTIGGGASASTWSTGGTGTFDDNSLLNAIYTPSPADTLAGSVVLTLTTDDPPGLCTSQSSQVTLTITSPPTANSGVDQAICEGDIVNLSGSIGGTATLSTWTTAGDGTFSSVSFLNADYTPGTNDLSNGSIVLTLTTNDPDSNCGVATDQVNIIIDQLLIANAGTDQQICPGDVVNLSGTFGGSATSSTWSSSGTGTFDDVNNLNAVYSPSSADGSVGSITLTLTANTSGPCSSASTSMLVDINQPISVVQQNLSIEIGQSTPVDVTFGGNFNPNDVLTTSIISPLPAQGSANVLANGIIEYTPDPSTVGVDSVTFEVCNQCGLCDQNIILIDIINIPPEIQPTTTTVGGGDVATIDITTFISDLNGNLDLLTLEIISQPLSGAVAFIDANNNLVIDYSGIPFVGTDELTIRVCDLLGACTTAVIFVVVNPVVITVYNAVSPNGDDKHDYLEINNIDLFPNCNVKIFNRWGDKIFDIDGYENTPEKAFSGQSNLGGKSELPAGTYFYSIDLGDGTQVKSGFFVMNR